MENYPKLLDVMTSEEARRLAEIEDAAEYLLAWMGMAHQGAQPILPKGGTWQYDTLRLRLLRLRTALASQPP